MVNHYKFGLVFHYKIYSVHCIDDTENKMLKYMEITTELWRLILDYFSFAHNSQDSKISKIYDHELIHLNRSQAHKVPTPQQSLLDSTKIYLVWVFDPMSDGSNSKSSLDKISYFSSMKISFQKSNIQSFYLENIPKIISISNGLPYKKNSHSFLKSSNTHTR